MNSSNSTSLKNRIEYQSIIKNLTLFILLFCFSNPIGAQQRIFEYISDTQTYSIDTESLVTPNIGKDESFSN